MEENREFSVVVRTIQGVDCGNSYNASSGSTAWIGKGLSCVCAQRREIDARISFELTPIQEECLQRLQSRIDATYDCSKLEHQKSFHDLLWKREGNRSLWEYPFAVAGVNITFMLVQMLDLQSAKPRTMMGAVFLKLLAEEKRAFDLLYCITFKLLDHQWLTMQASYMDFNAVMKATRRQVERELLLEDIQHLDDMPSFRLLIW